jgi:hypothetical protein
VCIPNPFDCNTEATDGAPVSIPFLLHSAINRQATLSGVSIIACESLDTTCKTPVGSPAVTGANGRANIEVPWGFDGYLQITGPGLYPALLYLAAPVPNALVDDGLDIGLFDPADVDYIAGAAHFQVDPAMGGAFIFPVSCGNLAVPYLTGATVAASPLSSESVEFYLVGGTPDRAAMATDVSGTAGIANLTPGNVTFTASLGQDTKSAPVLRLIRPGTITYIFIGQGP